MTHSVNRGTREKVEERGGTKCTRFSVCMLYKSYFLFYPVLRTTESRFSFCSSTDSFVIPRCFSFFFLIGFSIKSIYAIEVSVVYKTGHLSNNGINFFVFTSYEIVIIYMYIYIIENCNR